MKLTDSAERQKDKGTTASTWNVQRLRSHSERWRVCK